MERLSLVRFTLTATYSIIFHGNITFDLRRYVLRPLAKEENYGLNQEVPALVNY
jgi:hypothetical protein